MGKDLISCPDQHSEADDLRGDHIYPADPLQPLAMKGMALDLYPSRRAIKSILGTTQASELQGLT
jgi:hypothetical protein